MTSTAACDIDAAPSPHRAFQTLLCPLPVACTCFLYHVFTRNVSWAGRFEISRHAGGPEQRLQACEQRLLAVTCISASPAPTSRRHLHLGGTCISAAPASRRHLHRLESPCTVFLRGLYSIGSCPAHARRILQLHCTCGCGAVGCSVAVAAMNMTRTLPAFCSAEIPLC